MYFLKDKTWEEVRSGIFRKVYSLDKLKLDGVLPMIGLRMACCLGNRVEIVSTPQAVSQLITEEKYSSVPSDPLGFDLSYLGQQGEAYDKGFYSGLSKHTIVSSNGSSVFYE
eukprot:7306519-Prymnesium_polylepis.1